jgi:hypothetical protein
MTCDSVGMAGASTSTANTMVASSITTLPESRPNLLRIP